MTKPFSQILVAAPGLNDSFFERSVVLLFSLGKKTLAGLTINKPFYTTLEDSYTQAFSSGYPMGWREAYLFQGGPCERSNLYAIHSLETITDKSVEVSSTLAVTPLDMASLAAMAHEDGPQDIFFATGIVVWNAHDFCEQMDLGCWRTLPYERDLVFPQDREKLWDECKGRIDKRIRPGRPFVLKENLAVPSYFLSSWKS